MKMFKVKQHLQGRKIIENFVEANNEKEAEMKCKNEKFLNNEWKEVDEEYRLIDTEFELIKKIHVSKKGDSI